MFPFLMESLFDQCRLVGLGNAVDHFTQAYLAQFNTELAMPEDQQLYQR